MTDYERGVEQASAIYKEVIREYVAENAKLRELATMLHRCARGMLRDLAPSCVDRSKEGCGMDCTDNGERCCMELLELRMRELGIEVGE